MTYEEYLDDLLAKASARTAKYDVQRQQQANSSVQQVQRMYDMLDNTAVMQYGKRAEETADSYRDAYDANVANELVARRNATEAIANTNRVNSGLNNTQQTAISLSRSRADAQVTRQKTAAVDAIMRELDSVREQYRAAAADKAVDIQNRADEDKADYRAKQEYAAQDQAFDLYKADRDLEYKLYLQNLDDDDDDDDDGDGGSGEEPTTIFLHTVDTTRNRSFTAAKYDTLHMAKTKGQETAEKFVEQIYERGEITPEQRIMLRTMIGLRDDNAPTFKQMESMTRQICKQFGKEEAINYIGQLMNTGLIERKGYNELKQMIDVMHTYQQRYGK